MLSVAVTDCSFSQGDEISGSLFLLPSFETFGVIASELAEWLSAFLFVPYSPVWVWILDKTWERLSRRLYPSILFINGIAEPLPPIDVLLLSKITLPQCSTSLSTRMASLIPLTSRLHSISSGWARRFWKFHHSNVGDAIDLLFIKLRATNNARIFYCSTTTRRMLEIQICVGV